MTLIVTLCTHSAVVVAADTRRTGAVTGSFQKTASKVRRFSNFAAGASQGLAEVTDTLFPAIAAALPPAARFEAALALVHQLGPAAYDQVLTSPLDVGTYRRSEPVVAGITLGGAPRIAFVDLEHGATEEYGPGQVITAPPPGGEWLNGYAVERLHVHRTGQFLPADVWALDVLSRGVEAFPHQVGLPGDLVVVTVSGMMHRALAYGVAASPAFEISLAGSV